MVDGSIPRWKPSAEHGVNEGGESRDRESERRCPGIGERVHRAAEGLVVKSTKPRSAWICFSFCCAGAAWFPLWVLFTVFRRCPHRVCGRLKDSRFCEVVRTSTARAPGEVEVQLSRVVLARQTGSQVQSVSPHNSTTTVLPKSFDKRH